MKKYRFSCISALPFITAALSFSSSVMAQDGQDKWQAHVEAEGKWGSERNLGEVGAFLPVWQDENTLIFGDVRGRLDDQSSEEANLGLGLRQQISNGWIVGGYVFYDRRYTENDNMFHQATAGVEAMTENLELRLNGYLPEGDEKTVIPASAGSSSASVSGGTFQLTTTTSGGVVERALPGFDAEIGYKFELPDNWELWTYGGGFHFDADGYENISGPRGRAELSYNNVPYLGEGSKFTLGFETQTDNVRGGQSWGIARIRIPLNYSDAKKPSELSALDNRMTSRIVRDIDIVAAEKGTAAVTTTETATMTTASNQSATGYTVITAGDDLRAAIASGGNLVILDGTGGPIDTAFISPLNANQTVMSGGGTITLTGTRSGKTLTTTLPGSHATINNTSGNSTFRLNSGSVLQDVDITGGLTGIYIGTGATNVEINNVNISNVSDSGILADTASNISITNTTVDTADRGVTLGNGGGTTSNISGAVTATNIATQACTNYGTVNASTLEVNGSPCP